MWAWILDGILLIVVLGVIFYPRIRRRIDGTKLLNNHDFNEKISQGGQLVDIREAKEYRIKHIMGARNLPASQLDQSLGALTKVKSVLLYENGQPKAALRISRKLKKAGFTEIFILKDGLSKWGGKVKEN